MTRAALIEYFTHDHGVHIALVHPALDGPVVASAGAGPDGEPVTAATLRACALRLILDFHGLPQRWDQSPLAPMYRRALRLDPAVNALKRSGPILEQKIAKVVAFNYDMAYWRQLGAALLPEPIRRHLEDRELLCVVPHGALHALPFAALGWDDERLVADRFGVCATPSATVLKYCQLKNPARRDAGPPRRAFVAGMAAVEDEDPADLERDDELVGDFLQIEQRTGPGGEQPADKASVIAGMQRAELIHLACHGVFGTDPLADPMDHSGLLFSVDGARPSLRVATGPSLLSAREILGLDLGGASMVTLRACSTGRAEVRDADELFGISRAFLYAGAPSLLVSLWNVSKQSSRQLVREFYLQWLGRGLDKWQALQCAQRVLRGSAQYSHPYHWAPFVLIGDWL